jgi:hypothetical protein
MRWARTSAILGMMLFILSVGGCTAKVVVPPYRVPERIPEVPPRMGYSVQVGAFAQIANAIRLTKSLEDKGLPAFYFTHSSGLYKVRFGNYPSRSEAFAIAKGLKETGIIDVFYIVSPGEYVQARGGIPGARPIRDEIVATAQSFIGLPYQWCASSTTGMLDCSGLAMAVYQLNGINLPRNSADQFKNGIPIETSQLQKGDLVFFATSGSRVSHVGIYIGDNRFIHAPGMGKLIGTDSLGNPYFQERFSGACTYLR